MHVGNLDALDRAHRRAEGECGARVVGVDVHLERRLVADHDERVAEGVELRLELVAIERVPLDHEDGAVAVAGLLEVNGVGARRRDSRGRCRYGFAGDGAGESSEELDEPRTACVDHARLSEDAELLGRAGDRLIPVAYELDEQFAERLGVDGAPLRFFRELADDGQHRPLDRPADGSVGGVGGSAQRAGGERRADPIRHFGEDVGDASHDLGEDHAGVAAGSHQRRPGDGVRERGPIARLRRSDRLRDGTHGQREVGAGVAVGNGIDVEVVDAAAARLERGESRADEPAHQLEVSLGAHFPPVRTSSTCTSTARTESPVSRSTS